MTINATDGTNGTVAYNPDVTENVNLALSSCSSMASAAGDFSPTQVGVSSHCCRFKRCRFA